MTSNISAARIFDGIAYTQPISTNPNNIKIYLGTDSLAGVSIMFSANDIDTARQISPMLTNLLQINNATLLSHVSLGNQNYPDGKTKQSGDYVTLVRADPTLKGNEIKELVHPVLLRYKTLHQNMGANFVNFAAAAEHKAKQDSVTSQTITGNSPTEERLRSIATILNEAVNEHGGRITFHKLDNDGMLHLSTIGGCSGCGSIETTLSVIKEHVEAHPETTDTVKGFSHVGGKSYRFTPN